MGEETNEICSDVMWLVYVTLHEQSAQSRKKEQKNRIVRGDFLVHQLTEWLQVRDSTFRENNRVQNTNNKKTVHITRVEYRIGGGKRSCSLSRELVLHSACTRTHTRTFCRRWESTLLPRNTLVAASLTESSDLLSHCGSWDDCSSTHSKGRDMHPHKGVYLTSKSRLTFVFLRP